METSGYTTAGGVGVEREVRQVSEDALEEIVTSLGHRRGGAFSSGMDYPGRYSRWAFGYVDPCVELVAKGRTISARALNARGRVVLPAVSSCLLAAGKPVEEPTADYVEVRVDESEDLLPEELRSRRPTVFTAIREVIAAFKGDDPHLGLYGAFGYDLAFQFEPIRQELTRPDDQRDLVLHLPDRLVVIDRQRETCVDIRYEFTVDGATTRGLERTGESTPLAAPAQLPPDPVRGDYAKVVAAAKEKFKRGDLFEVVPGQVFHATCTDPAAFYRSLRHSNPAPYEFIISLGEGEHLVGASPEMFVRVSGDRVETCPISGTIARGANPVEDAEAIRTLLTSVKEESELTMCTDVDRNDKSRVCVPGTVKVIGRRQIELYSRLIHTVDHIEGRLRPEFDALDAFLTHMWAVTVTGAPKTWAMQFIEDHEATTRRWYGGAIGFIGFDGSMNTGLTLRTAQVKDGIATVRAGATLLFDSDPEAEERETELKASALLGALAAVNQPEAAPVAVPRRQSGQGMKVLLVDHEDSFVNTLADYFRQEGADVVTLRHGFPAQTIDEIGPDLVVLSPGPGWPSDFGMAALIDEIYARELPVFGVCLGLQAMVEQAGGSLELLDYPEHGKRGRVARLGGSALLDGLPEEFTAARYHSLHAKRPGVVGFTPTAVTPDGNVMAIEDTANRRFAVQFHPESILTAEGGAGAQVIANVLRLSRRSA
ncbi:anthranilate synthase component I [Nonomuraea glycinis]|uniref:Anthranilate synthase n=1 Tax=Nonomuraea glycinis TaxID=2047744 RepID=A0A918E5I6_9ACTN|nr:anthranilate synthase component I [Nonomuraea glycinis]MCA2177955.1 anthranilate synthase component I [Nonomuraea glycinis]WSG65800.1 anthranilate synthase component I [Nonomuraea glycinis]GGP06349.1 anthranilate synthase component I [Nonomuraea glycinis]